MTVPLRGIGAMVQNADGTFSVKIDPDVGNINLPWTATVQAPMTADSVTERYMSAVSQAYLNTLPDEYVQQQRPGLAPQGDGPSPVALVAAAVAVFALGHVMGKR